MKKQFLRYKLIADQKVGRANKSEVLNDELLQVEKHMDHVKTACASTYKKMIQCNHSHGAGDFEKRLKRLKESELAQGMLDASKTLLNEPDSNQMLGSSLKVCGDVQADLAKEKTMYEMFVDDHVVLPLQTLVETEIPNIIKLRDRLKRLVLDRDSAFQNLSKGKKAQYTAGANIQQAQVKLEALNDEYSQAVSRMEQCKDQLITEMFEFVANEAGHNQRISDFHAKQLDYHRRCVKVLESTAPYLEEIQNNAVSKCSFGRSLKEHLRASEREIALPLEACALCILHMGGIKEEGIFRIGGGAGKLRKFRALVDGGVLDLFEYDAQDDIHAVAGAMKQYLRELPDPLLTHRLHNEWIASASITEEDQKLQELWRIIDNLPPENQANLKYLVKFLAHVAQYQDVNKMSASNLSVVLAPNLLWTHMDDISTRMVESSLIAGLVELMITFADWFFPGEMDFVVTPNGTSYHTRSDSTASTEKVPLSPTAPKKSPGHSRNPSSDTNLETSLSAPQQPSSAIKKRKSKAPKPPQLPPQIPNQDHAPKTHERKRSSPTLVETPTILFPNNNRPPIAAQRKSTKKPQIAPPQPPEEAPEPHKEEVPSHNGPTPKPKPRPPVRKHKSNDQDRPQSITDPSIFQPPEEGIGGEPQSPPMPNQSPPPLPPIVVTEGLASELRVDSNNPFQSEDESELTCL